MMKAIKKIWKNLLAFVHSHSNSITTRSKELQIQQLRYSKRFFVILYIIYNHGETKKKLNIAISTF